LHRVRQPTHLLLRMSELRTNISNRAPDDIRQRLGDILAIRLVNLLTNTAPAALRRFKAAYGGASGTSTQMLNQCLLTIRRECSELRVSLQAFNIRHVNVRIC
jgi:hypothetical protein